MTTRKHKKGDDIPTPFLKPADALVLITREMKAHSKRGFVLVCGAVIDRALEKLIRTKFTALSKATDAELNALLTKRPLPPLGSASIRARIARVLGVIDKATCDALCKLFDLRNRFAHKEIAPSLTREEMQPIFDLLPKHHRVAFVLPPETAMEPDNIAAQNFLRRIAASLLVSITSAQYRLEASTLMVGLPQSIQSHPQLPEVRSFSAAR